MDIQTAYSQYQTFVDIESESFKKQKYRIDRYILFVSPNTNAKEAMSSENLILFFNTLERGINGFYYTLKAFYGYVLKDVFGVSQSELKAFPIEPPEGYNISSEVESRKGKDNYLDFDFNFELMFENEFYEHMKNYTATITLKAAFALGLGAAYTTNHIKKMKLEDVLLENDYVKVKNKNNIEQVEYIILKGKLAKYVREYYLYCKERVAENSLLFVKHWSGYELIINEDLSKVNGVTFKPSEIIPLANYLLRSISYQLDIEPALYFAQLHKNSVAHYLYHTKGEALDNILRAYGMETGFVKSAYRQYMEKRDYQEFLGFNPFEIKNILIKNDIEDEPFFQISSSDKLSDDEKERLEYITKKYYRNSKIVKELKSEYNNCCQICGQQLIEHNNPLGYSEVHHIQPLFKGGKDIKENLLVLCPNHHTLMDMGVIALDPKDLITIHHIDETSKLHNSKLQMVLHDISKEYVSYNFERIYKPLQNILSEKVY